MNRKSIRTATLALSLSAVGAAPADDRAAIFLSQLGAISDSALTVASLVACGIRSASWGGDARLASKLVLVRLVRRLWPNYRTDPAEDYATRRALELGVGEINTAVAAGGDPTPDWCGAARRADLGAQYDAKIAEVWAEPAAGE